MSIECYDKSCKFHGDHFGVEGPFCDELECKKETDQDRTQLCKEFTELTGGHWHEWTIQPDCFNGCNCGVIFTDYNENPTYTNPADVLNVMKLRNYWEEFISWLYIHQTEDSGMLAMSNYIVEPDSLLKAAVEFLKEKAK